MRVIGHGIDLVEVARIQELIDNHGDRFLNRCFTADEIAYARRRPKRLAEHLAARFAAKEAVLKAMGTGLRRGICWVDIEVVRLPTGEPTLKLTAAAEVTQRECGICTWQLSLSHVSSIASASVIALG